MMITSKLWGSGRLGYWSNVSDHDKCLFKWCFCSFNGGKPHPAHVPRALFHSKRAGRQHIRIVEQVFGQPTYPLCIKVYHLQCYKLGIMKQGKILTFLLHKGYYLSDLTVLFNEKVHIKLKENTSDIKYSISVFKKKTQPNKIQTLIAFYFKFAAPLLYCNKTCKTQIVCACTCGTYRSH